MVYFCLFRPWSSRIDYFENNRQNLFSNLELVISENSQNFGLLFVDDKKKITGCYFPETGIDDQGLMYVVIYGGFF